MTKDDRAARLAAQLRANLKRRKEQARGEHATAAVRPAGEQADGDDAGDQRRTSDPAA
ncbi:hypothetical protein [Sphingomonas abaci]|uniref:Uncharacterized protein n=1 Tax=Sphingomonas abaci TaxID=237611 RepID=A0A7W7ANR2_9SPHN|nr:hypothetical protein [Sphingomonas abaci]MBB4619377.1 hypothetical protein [Sphingomonas abaci]